LFSSTDSSAHWCFTSISIPPDDGFQLAQSIRNNSATVNALRAVTDGSFKDNFGTAAWILECANTSQQMSGSVVAPGSAHDHSSYRSELSGVYAALLVTNRLCLYFNISEGSILLGCDSKSALAMAFTATSFRYSIKTPCFDLLGAIRQLRISSPIQWEFTHIKGHQDQRIALQDLSDLELLNVAMDNNAKAHLPHARSQPRHYAIYLEPWSIWHGGKKIATNLHSTIYGLVHSHAAKLYWLKKNHIDQDNFDSIHWSALHQAHRESSQSHQAFVIKSSVGMCGVGKFLKRWKQSSTSACPRFSADSEDITHVWKSPAPEVKDLWTTTIANLRTWLDEQHTDPSLSNILLTYLHCWRESLPFPEASNRLHDLVQNQSDIGWDGPFYGWMSQHWANIQQEFFNSICSRRTGQRWLISVIKKMWDVSWDFWNHRNGVMHNKAQLSASDISQLDRSVTNAYQDLVQHPSRNTRPLIFLPLRNILSKDARYKSVWLRQAIAAVSTTTRGARRSLLKMRICLESWLRCTRQVYSEP